MTERVFTAQTTGPITVDLESANGTITATVDPMLKAAQVVVRTADSEGLAADAVNRTTSSEDDHTLTVKVPELQGATIGGGTTVFQSNGSISIGQSFGIVTGSVTGAVISDGDIWIGGRQIVRNGTVVAEAGTVVGTGSASGVQVEIRLPLDSALRVSTRNASITTHGALSLLDVNGHNSSVTARGDVGRLLVSGHNSDVWVESVSSDAQVGTHNGSIEIDSYTGVDARLTTHNGSIRVQATRTASGTIDARTHNGNIRVRGGDHLNVRTRTHNGRVL